MTRKLAMFRSDGLCRKDDQERKFAQRSLCLYARYLSSALMLCQLVIITAQPVLQCIPRTRQA